MGTSLKVHPFSSLVDQPKKGTPRLLINREVVGTFQYSKASTDYLLLGDCDDGCLQIAEALGWGEELVEMSKL